MQPARAWLGCSPKAIASHGEYPYIGEVGNQGFRIFKL
jgi:hypothetical protein